METTGERVSDGDNTFQYKKNTLSRYLSKQIFLEFTHGRFHITDKPTTRGKVTRLNTLKRDTKGNHKQDSESKK